MIRRDAVTDLGVDAGVGVPAVVLGCVTVSGSGVVVGAVGKGCHKGQGTQDNLQIMTVLKM